jgi:hypothetical protein
MNRNNKDRPVVYSLLLAACVVTSWAIAWQLGKLLWRSQ